LGSNQFSAAANLTLSQHFLEKTKMSIHSFKQDHEGNKQNDRKVKNTKSKTKMG